MIVIEFTAYVGDRKFPVVLTCDNSTGGTHWDIMINGKKYEGIQQRGNDYYYHGNFFTVDDVQALVDRITDFKGEPYHQACFHQWKTDTEYWSQFPKFNRNKNP